MLKSEVKSDLDRKIEYKSYTSSVGFRLECIASG